MYFEIEFSDEIILVVKLYEMYDRGNCASKYINYLATIKILNSTYFLIISI